MPPCISVGGGHFCSPWARYRLLAFPIVLLNHICQTLRTASRLRLALAEGYFERRQGTTWPICASAKNDLKTPCHVDVVPQRKLACPSRQALQDDFDRLPRICARTA